MTTLEKSTVKSLSVPSGFSREDYRIERQWATAPDGEKVKCKNLRHCIRFGRSINLIFYDKTIKD